MCNKQVFFCDGHHFNSWPLASQNSPPRSRLARAESEIVLTLHYLYLPMGLADAAVLLASPAVIAAAVRTQSDFQSNAQIMTMGIRALCPLSDPGLHVTAWAASNLGSGGNQFCKFRGASCSAHNTNHF